MTNWIGLYTLIKRNVLRMLRVSVQTLFTPWITATLYIFVFGLVVGARIGDIEGVSYIDFVLPGLVMMNIIMSSFGHTSSIVYMQRFMRSIEEILVAPFSYMEMIIGFAIGGVIRGLIIGLGVYILALFFTSATIEHFGLFLVYAISISIIFSFVGMIVGILSNHFEHLTLLNTFVIMPFIFLGGVFNSISMMPEVIQGLIKLNPFFYFVDGIRFAMIGISESNLLIGATLITLLMFGSGFVVWYFFKTGYRIRE